MTSGYDVVYQSDVTLEIHDDGIDATTMRVTVKVAVLVDEDGQTLAVKMEVIF
jgi:hypothetical protein